MKAKNNNMYTVRQINNKDTKPFILYKHYAKRMPSISYSFGLFINGDLKGVCTFGQPAGACLSKGLFGGGYIKQIIELNRLFIDDDVDLHCAASRLVSSSIKLLRNNICIVSFADSTMNHVGTVYKACNFIYTGLSAKRTEWVIEGMEHLHSKSIADKAKKGGGRWDELKNKYGNKLKKRNRPQKHRYIYIKADKKTKKKMMQDLQYTPTMYPEGESSKYNVSKAENEQLLMKL